MRDRLRGPLDALLHLMDRQVIDDAGLMVCKCDDLELSQTDDGLAVTALLVGNPVWVPRLGGWLARTWSRLGGVKADRDRPYRIGLEDIDRVSQAIVLCRGRDGVLTRQQEPQHGVRRVVGDLIGTTVHGPDGDNLGAVLDVRLEPGPPGQLRVTHLLIGRGRPGTYLGYDRRQEQGPWLIAKVVQWLHRDSGMVPISGVRSIDRERGLLHITTRLTRPSSAEPAVWAEHDDDSL